MARFDTSFDATSVEPTTAYELLPAGKYRAQIVESEMRVTKNGMGQFLWLMLDILEGEHKGRKIFDQLNLVNPNPTTVEIAQRTLSAICHAKRGEIRALASMGVLTTGFNAPGVDLIALLRPTQSAGLYVQMVGRGTRLAPGKENCLVLDFAGNVRRHGPIDLVRPKRPGDGGGGEAPTKVCPECDSIIALSATECPDCGYVFPAREVKIAATAATLPVLSPKQQWLPVTGVSYSRHDKAGGRPSLKVTYSSGLATYSEWVCLEHQGYARQKAAEWWRKRAPGSPVPLSVAEALAQASRLARPSDISVRPSGRYLEISGYRFAPCAHPTPAFAPSATGNLAALAGSNRGSAVPILGVTPAASGSAAAPVRTSVMGGRA